MSCALALDSLKLASFKGVGERTLDRLDKLGLHSVQDLLFHLPIRYEDRTFLTPLGRLRPGDHALVEGRVELAEIPPKGRRSLVCRIADGTGFLYLRFFHFTADQLSRLNPGTWLRCYGEARDGYYGVEMVHPDYQHIAETESGHIDKSLTPVYPLTEGLHQKTLRKLVDGALDSCTGDKLVDWIPVEHLEAMGFPPLYEALRLLHKPPAGVGLDSLRQAQQRLAFEELLAHHLSLSRFRERMRKQAAPLLRLPEAQSKQFRKTLPFDLTGAQQRVIEEIAADLARLKPMMRLVQGDVGSGKTVVAAWAALAALASDCQVAVMAPTELLAEQHYRSFSQWLEPLGVQLAYLASKHKGQVRRETLEAIAEGRAGAVLGTHALFQEQVKFQRLGLVVIDEQHRFGVHQRLALREKGMQDGLYPHQLIMTATPIPRTLAMLGYADLDVSIIDELPPGRTPVKTSVIPATRRPELIDRIAEWVKGERQVYWVCTLIEESEVLECEAAQNTATALAQALPGVRVELVHGRMKPAEKEAVMASFKAGAVDLLVATTVIEVGVDVPNAGLMVIENPERLGLAQLHQLRGRVGRGPGESHCVLMYQPPLSAGAKERLGILRETSDGFIIAEKDLELRGPGEFLGVRQTGQVQFRIADLSRDGGMLDRVKCVAENLLRDHPDHVEPLLRRWLADSGRYAEV
ncbi:MAG: ATP-dependent DNA helicase RecG [Methylococcaceae bacterium]|nr:ATP-dependent DNA helicase RecG [Methylococcaceae bacterium]